MLLKAIILGSTFLLFGRLNAQIPEPSIETKLSHEFLNKKKEILRGLLYSDATGHYALFANGRYGDGKKSIRKFDLDFHPTPYRVKLDFPKKTLEPHTISITSSGENLYHFWKVRNREGIDFFVEEINLPTQGKKPIQPIASVDYKYGYTTRTKSVVLKDNSKRMLLVSEIFGNQNESVELRVDSFDENLNPNTGVHYTIPHPSEQFSIVSLTSYADNTFILIGKKYASGNISKSTKRKEYEYLVYSLNNGKTNLLTTISPNDKHLNQLVSKILDDTLLITGFIANQTISKPNAIYFLKYDLLNSQVEIEKRNPLPNSFYVYPEKRDEKTATLQIGFRNKKKEADSNYQIKDVFINDTNEVVLVAEQNFIVENNSPIMNGQGALTPTFGGKTFYSNDIAVLKISDDGDLLWHAKIIKRQQWGGDKTVLSYYPVYKNNKLFLFYNGNYLNIENPGSKFIYEKDAALICTIVEEDGTFQRKVITYYTEEYPNVLLPGLSNYHEEFGAVLYHRAPGNLKRQKFIQAILR